MKIKSTGCAECLDVGDGERNQGRGRLWARATGRKKRVSGSEVEKQRAELITESV